METWLHGEIPMFHDKGRNDLDIIRGEKHLVLPGARVSREEYWYK